MTKTSTITAAILGLGLLAGTVLASTASLPSALDANRELAAPVSVEFLGTDTTLAQPIPGCPWSKEIRSWKDSGAPVAKDERELAEQAG